MTEDKVRESLLIAKEIAKEVCSGTPSDSLVFIQWKQKHENEYQKLLVQKNLLADMAYRDSIDADAALRKVSKQIHVSRRRTFVARAIGIAASLVLIVGVSLYVVLSGYSSKGDKEVIVSNSICQSSSFDSINVVFENLSIQGNRLVGESLDGKKNVNIKLKKENQMNRLSVPRTGSYKLTLTDRSIVQINGGSELLFPTHFGPSRQVMLTGEACFKVASDESHPFHVRVGEIDVCAVGTTFNIKAYDDENELHITLMEGSLRVSDSHVLLAMLTQGQKMSIRKADRSYHIANTDGETEMAWTQGQFIFRNEPIANIVRDLSRWYDVSIQVNNEIKEQRYSGILLRSHSLEEILNTLRMTNELDFSVRKNKQVNIVEKEN